MASLQVSNSANMLTTGLAMEKKKKGEGLEDTVLLGTIEKMPDLEQSDTQKVLLVFKGAIYNHQVSL